MDYTFQPSPTAATHIPHLNIIVMLARCCMCWVSIPPNLKFSPKSHILRLSAWVLRNCHSGSPNEQQKRPPSPTRCLDFPSGLCLELRNPLALLQRATKCDFIFWVQVDAFWEASVTHQALETSLSSFYTFHYPGCSGMQLLRGAVCLPVKELKKRGKQRRQNRCQRPGVRNSELSVSVVPGEPATLLHFHGACG